MLALGFAGNSFAGDAVVRVERSSEAQSQGRDAMIASLSDQIRDGETWLPRWKKEFKKYEAEAKARPAPPKGCILMCGDTLVRDTKKRIRTIGEDLKKWRKELSRLLRARRMERATRK